MNAETKAAVDFATTLADEIDTYGRVERYFDADDAPYVAHLRRLVRIVEASAQVDFMLRSTGMVHVTDIEAMALDAALNGEEPSDG